jgi:ABC-type spermidine/putrescine transport system permease subunit II
MSTDLRSPLAWLLLPVTGLVMAFILAPLVVTVAMSVSDTPYVVFPPRGFTFGWYAKILQDPDFQASLWFSTTLALGATAGPAGSPRGGRAGHNRRASCSVSGGRPRASTR